MEGTNMTKQPESVKDTISRSIGEAKEAPEEGKELPMDKQQPESARESIQRAIGEVGETRDSPEETGKAMSLLEHAKKAQDFDYLRDVVVFLVEWVQEIADSAVASGDAAHKWLASHGDWLDNHAEQLHDLRQGRLDDLAEKIAHHKERIAEIAESRKLGQDGGKSKPPTSRLGQGHNMPPPGQNQLQETLAQLVEQLATPKEIVRDMHGRPVGIRPNKAFAAAAPNGHLKDAGDEETPHP
jgi:hypothetical protein